MKTETAQLSRVLKKSIHTLGLSLREVERRLGMSRGYLTRLFAGEMDLKMDHVVDIAGALGIEAEEIFQLAFPRTDNAPSQDALRLREAFGVPSLAPVQTAAAAALEQAVEQIVNRALGKALRKLAQ
jgi:transcriptional regulator with XRE-family HTH domain